MKRKRERIFILKEFSEAVFMIKLQISKNNFQLYSLIFIESVFFLISEQKKKKKTDQSMQKVGRSIFEYQN